MTDLEWVFECRYISDVTDKKGRVQEMNYETATFVVYCKMQRDTAQREGRFDTVTYIQQCIDDLT